MERALLATIALRQEEKEWRMEDSACELEELVSACGVEVVDNISCFCDRPTPNLLIGRGKAEELKLIAQEEDADVVIFSHDLSGTQQRNLEDVIGKKTIDRTQLILDIFARRAKTPEGKIQVELAQLQYLMPRLIGKGIILSRLGGGVGTRGPGEQKLELDRRTIRKRIDRLRDDLKGVIQHRLVTRKKRKESFNSAIALVGYTSAGKSTLINALTNSNQTVSALPFTTLDPLIKDLKLPGGESVLISDTVGFLHDLPHHLIESFKATLEEAVQADVLIHVLDASHPYVYDHNKSVLDVLSKLGVAEKPIITALNKIDLLDDKMWLEKLKNDFNNSVAISAKSKQNLDYLLLKIQESLPDRMFSFVCLIAHSRMDIVDLFYRKGNVENVEYLQKGIRIKASLPRIYYNKLLHNKEIQIVD